ncbi:division/cell wall cluster transcriptional repressor MraZ [Salinarimonas rosea]|uniref:division/cell wall cluster transcriptional repressor MraZ n=1 Tax=Salinarimonas rosea TaxID=552063 RepID=UPI000415EFDB|nr:division/cell wall cluster transcriptional repressor MraZ [Salinarimonas rosea]
MNRFVSNFTNRLDAKGRVSIPATFRAVLARDGFEGLYVHPALDAPALDAGGNRLLEEIDAFLSSLTPYSDERDQLSTALFGTSEILKVDTEGRVILTESVKAHAEIADSVTFVGLGHKFQIWEPERFRAHLEAARAKVRDLKRSIGTATLGTTSLGASAPSEDDTPGARVR